MNLKSNKIKYIFTVLFLISTVLTVAQNAALKQFESEFDQLDYKTRLTELRKFKPNALSIKDRALFEHLSGKTEYLNSSGVGAVEHFVKAKELYLQAKDFDKVAELLVTLAEQKSLSNYKYADYKPLLDEAIIYAEKSKNPDLLCKTYKQIGKSIYILEPQKAIAYFQKAIAIAQKNKLFVHEIKINGNIGVTYFEVLNDLKKARYYHNLSLEISKKHNHQEGIAYAYVNFAAIFRKEKNYEAAVKYYLMALELKFDNYRANVDLIVLGYISDTYKEMKNYEKAFEYLDKKKALEKELSDQEENKIIRDINTKYETQKKELENQELKIKDQKNKLFLYSFIGLFLVFVIGAYFRISHINKKKKIAEQEKLIESQKLENVLKEQELLEIDKILEGQEKERLKLANELHDNLGSILATLRLNFQNLYQQTEGIKEEERELFAKTDELIEDAYQKVRGMAHAKNAGVIGSEGLVPAVQNIAKKVAIPNKLKVQVIPFGMTKRLENALEVTLFRMIQEILTNTIKHAQATEITISLTQDDDTINILIEDNGKGFNPKAIDKKEGMGLSNIEKKVEQLNGTFNIDSFEGKGTTIIIDIPL
ncbi:sensor histidine kinase [Flavobacterium sp. IMCC34852]|uniref:Oxygen sensor histidine kinase NreB n=1 Tax=Flavobacterium rivulicola TaxID=2732161 RepID=A0A7Y3VZG7_9FLAO|nr:sensor histidine kinase [Flavobacterium sp. IMCC34852]NNT72739.1 sensor histidine kinase [Flavobacterium sp. IMCC34852]